MYCPVFFVPRGCPKLASTNGRGNSGWLQTGQPSSAKPTEGNGCHRLSFANDPKN